MIKYLWVLAGLAILISVGAMAAETGQSNLPVELTADVLKYNTQTNIASADGNVRVTQGTSIITGQHAQYNEKLQNGKISGNVTGKSRDASLNCDEVDLLPNNLIVALGNVIAKSKGYTFEGKRLEYDLNINRIYSPITSIVFTADGSLRSGRLEYYIDKQVGNAYDGVRIQSPARGVIATANQAKYLGGTVQTISLLGNAHATQNGNSLDGQQLDYYISDNVFVAEGKTKVIFYPGSEGAADKAKQ